MGSITKKLLNILFIITISISFSACIFFTTKNSQTITMKKEKCKLTFKKKRIEVKKMGMCNSPECLALFGIIIPVGSLVVSGSIVAVNNTLHWIEYNGKCDDGLLKSMTN